jgi:hypothetical protein
MDIFVSGFAARAIFFTLYLTGRVERRIRLIRECVAAARAQGLLFRPVLLSVSCRYQGNQIFTPRPSVTLRPHTSASINTIIGAALVSVSTFRLRADSDARVGAHNCQTALCNGFFLFMSDEF